MFYKFQIDEKIDDFLYLEEQNTGELSSNILYERYINLLHEVRRLRITESCTYFFGKYCANN